MADLSSLINPGAGGAQPGGMLSALTPNGGPFARPVAAPQAPPTPTHEQAVAGYHRAQEIKQRMGKILDDPRAGHANIRPLVLDAGATLVGERIMSLAELMRGLSDFPGADNPLAQKQWVRHLVAVNSMAQRKLLMDHRAANAPDYQHGTHWSADKHSDHMAGLMTHYPNPS